MRHTRESARALAPIALMTAALLVSLLLAPPSLAAPAGRDGGQATAQSVDINTATVEQLMSVPGIGQVIAQRIVEFREKNGPYGSVDDLLKVQGIGEKSLARIRERLSAGKAKK